jgi:hypothetical protein
VTSIPRVGEDGDRERERHGLSDGPRGREEERLGGGGERDSRGLLQEREAEREYLGKFKL